VSEAAETWAWAQAVDSTAKIVLYWLAHTETRGISRSGPTVISEYSGLPQRAVERAFSRLENGNFISRLKRGVYELSLVVKTVTSDGLDPANYVGVETVTSDGPYRHERRSLARADLITTTTTTPPEEQSGFFTDVEWVRSIHESTWTSTKLTVQQVAQIEKKYGEIDLHETAMRWENWHAEGKGKRRRPKDIYRSFTNWLRKEQEHGTGTRKSSELAAINREGRGGGYANADRYRP
jgi:hypothetical protein